MIRRDVDVSKLEGFDFFNDAKETVLWLQGAGRGGEAAVLEIAHHRWIDAQAKPTKHCETCICGKRAPVQANRRLLRGPGSVSWEEHLTAWSAYAAKYGPGQSAERLAERGGFCYGELVEFLGREPKSWRPA